MNALPLDIERDVLAISEIDGIETILKILARTTNLRIALVARVTETSWTCCSVLDEAGFGLAPGDSLDLATTY